MLLRYNLPDGTSQEVALGPSPLTIGRNSGADISLADQMVSRIHCGILWRDNAFYIRDYQSRNGTFINDERIEMAPLQAGDRLRIGNTILTVAAKPRRGAATVMQEVQQEMASGKGYHTLLQEIIREENPR